METLLKSEFAARLRVSKARISQMVAMGMPLTADGKVDVTAALSWIETHIDLSHKDSAARRRSQRTEKRLRIQSTCSRAALGEFVDRRYK